MSLESLIEYRPEFEEHILAIHDYMLEQGLEYKVRFRLPFYYGGSWLAYINIPKPKRKKDPFLLELCFINGILLPSGPRLLDFKGRAQIGGLSYSADDELDWDKIGLLLGEALELEG